MNTAHFVTDRLIYIPDFVQLADAASLENNLASITDHSWRYDGGIKHQLIGGQLSKGGRLIQSGVAEWAQEVFNRVHECTAVQPNYAELYAISAGQAVSEEGMKETNATLTLSTHVVVQTEVSHSPLLLEPGSLLIVVDASPPRIVPGMVDRVVQAPATILNASQLTSEPYKTFVKDGGQLPRKEGYLMTMYNVKKTTKAFMGVLGVS